MGNIITRTHYGAIDLYNGVPNLKNAVIIDVIYGTEKEYETTLIIRDTKGNLHNIGIKQA